MLFKPELVAKVLDGTKTMTRRVKHGEGDACPFVMGRQRAIQPGRGKFHVAHVTLTEVTHEHLGFISDADAIREGFASRSEFLAYWERLHGEVDKGVWLCVLGWERAYTDTCCAEASA